MLLDHLGGALPTTLKLPPLGKAPTNAQLLERAAIVRQSLNVAEQAVEKRLSELAFTGSVSRVDLTQLRAEARDAAATVKRYWDLRVQRLTPSQIERQLHEEGYRHIGASQKWDRGTFPHAFQRLNTDWRLRTANQFHIPSTANPHFSYLMGCYCGKLTSFGWPSKRAPLRGDLAFHLPLKRQHVAAELREAITHVTKKGVESKTVVLTRGDAQTKYTRLRLSGLSLSEHFFNETKGNTQAPLNHPSLQSTSAKIAFIRGFFAFAGTDAFETVERIQVKKSAAGAKLLADVALLLKSFGISSTVNIDERYAHLNISISQMVQKLTALIRTGSLVGEQMIGSWRWEKDKARTYTAFVRLREQFQQGIDTAPLYPTQISDQLHAEIGVQVPPSIIKSWLEGSQPIVVKNDRALDQTSQKLGRVRGKYLGYLTPANFPHTPAELVDLSLKLSGGSLPLSERLHLSPMRVEAWSTHAVLPTWPETARILEQFHLTGVTESQLEFTWHLDFAEALFHAGYKLPGRMLLAAVARHHRTYVEFLPKLREQDITLHSFLQCGEALCAGVPVDDHILSRIVSALPLEREHAKLIRFLNQSGPDHLLAIEALLLSYQALSSTVEPPTVAAFEGLVGSYQSNGRNSHITPLTSSKMLPLLRTLSGMSAAEISPATTEELQRIESATNSCDWNKYGMTRPTLEQVRAWIDIIELEPIQHRHLAGLHQRALRAYERGESPRLAVMSYTKQLVKEEAIKRDQRRALEQEQLTELPFSMS